MTIKYYLLAALLICVSGLTHATTTTPITVGGEHYSLSLKADGTLWAFGANESGQLGLGASDFRQVPTQITDLTDVVAIAAGYQHSLALKRDGTLWAFGGNDFGQLGLGNFAGPAVFTPTQVTAVSDVVAIAAGEFHSLVLKRDGTLWAFGISGGQLGLGNTFGISVYTPTQVTALTDVVAVSAGYYHSLALKRDGTLWAFGGNYNGQLGLGGRGQRLIPTQITALTDVVAISAGSSHSLALKRDGTLWAFGYNRYGELGLGDIADRDVPTRVTALTDVVAISGKLHSLALKRDGSLWAFGYNHFGQLGLGDTTRRSSPTKITALTDVVAISAGSNHSFALKRDGSLWSFGYGLWGQLGLGDSDDRHSPTQVEAASHVASTLSTAPIDLGTVVRGAALTTSETFAVTTPSSSMTMDFDKADIASSGSLASYSAATCVSGDIADTNTPCRFKVISKPTGNIGLQRALLTIPASSTFAKAVILPVVANIIGGQLYADTRAPFDFGTKALASSTDKVISFTNKGDADVLITTVVQSGTAFSVIADTCTNSTLIANASCAVSLRFRPTVLGAVSGEVTINSNDPVTPTIKIPMTGFGDTVKLVVTRGPLHFANVNVGGEANAMLTLTNTGTRTIYIESITEPSHQFSLSTTCAATLAANDSCTVTVRFAPLSTGLKSTSIKIVTDDPALPTRTRFADGTGI